MAFITISKAKFYHNLQYIAQKAGSIEKIAIVLKDNAYGHGLILMAKMASEYGIKSAVVRNQEEAQQIERFFGSVLVLGDTQNHSHHTYVINSLEAIEHIPKHTQIALKVDTGMHRNGIAVDELDFALKKIIEKDLTLVDLMTHYRSADVLSSEFFWQQKVFEKVKKEVKNAGFTNLRIHSHNSASLLRTQHFDEDIVRVGLALYGYDILHPSFNKTSLKPILSLYAKRISSRYIKRGQRVGYGGEFIALRDMNISTYDLGYGDGWHRGECTLSGGVTILGRVSMDSISIESQKKILCIMDNAEEIAKQWKTISYEVLTCLDNKIDKEVI